MSEQDRRTFLKSFLATASAFSILPRIARAAGLYNMGAFWRPQSTPHSLWVWGDLSYCWIPSTLSYPDTIFTSSPVQLPGNWLQVTGCGDGIDPSFPPSYNVAIRSDNTLWGWGDNNFGQLGQGNYVPAPSAVQIPGSWTQVSAGGSGTGAGSSPVNPFVLAIQSGGTLWAWGDNTYGQLAQGNTSTINIPSPIQVPGTWSTVAAGAQFWAGIQSNGTLWACGLNLSGQFGQANTTSYSSPVLVTSATNWTNVSVTYDTKNGGGAILALNSLGQLWGCGSNYYGELLHATTTRYYSSPVQLSGSWTQVSTGGLNYALGLQPGGALFAWGHGTSGELGNGAHTNLSSPVQITGSWSQIASGVYAGSFTQINSSFAINSLGQLFGWGSNPYSGAKVSSPVQITGSWAQVFSGMDSSFGIQPGSTLWAWGDNSWGNVLPGSNGWPEGTNLTISSPTQIGGSWLQISGAGTSFYVNDPTYALAIRSDYTLWGWGSNTAGQLAQASLFLFRSPVQIAGSWTQIGTGGTGFGWSLGIRSDSSLWTWGSNGSGQLGIGSVVDKSSPVQVSGGGSWTQVTGGANSTFGIKTDGTLWGWGANDGGQLGTLANPTTAPTRLFTGQGSFIQVTAGDDPGGLWGIPVLAINTQKQLWVMGVNGYGELGTNSTTGNYSSPTQVPGSWNQVSTSFYGNTVAIRSDGTLWAWGQNDFGECAQSTAVVAYSSPVQVSSLTWTQCWAGLGVGYAIRSDNTLWVWGDVSDCGSLGFGAATFYSSPVQIAGNWSHITTASSGYQNYFGGFALGLR